MIALNSRYDDYRATQTDESAPEPARTEDEMMIAMDVLTDGQWVHCDHFDGTPAQIREDDDPVVIAAVEQIEAGASEVVTEASWATFRLRVIRS